LYVSLLIRGVNPNKSKSQVNKVADTPNGRQNKPRKCKLLFWGPNLSLSIGVSLKINSNIPKEGRIDETSFTETRAEN
jgi:hypothetical protein